MKKLLVFLFVLILILAGFWFIFSSGAFNSDEKLYVAVEGEGKIVVVDTATRKVIKEVDLSRDHEGGKLVFAPHNVQVAPDGGSVWITANVKAHEASGHSLVRSAAAHGDGETALDEPDEVIVINPKSDRIVKRLPIASGALLAHVVLTPDSKTAYVTSQLGSAIYKVDAAVFTLEKIELAPGKEPHGLRASPDGDRVYIAFLGGKSMGIMDVASGALNEIALEGQVMQTGVTPDGRLALASLYDTKELALYHVVSKTVAKIKLPGSSRGPIQMYPTPDSRYVYVADQGYYFGAPTGEFVYKIDLDSKSVAKEIKVGKGPHGVVVSKDGNFIYVTNLLSNDLSIIDTRRDEEIGRILVGKEPNGVSLWSHKEGGTP